jgi:hypothetical protein
MVLANGFRQSGQSGFYGEMVEAVGAHDVEAGGAGNFVR